MKKILSTLLALCMILSICSFQISAAPQGKAITSEAEFLAMKEDGSYYLANDITVTKSYEQLFTGYFDGNGKTVTVTGEPMFLEFCGKAKNLTINGEIVADHAKDNGYWARGAFACMASGDETVTLYGITNNANVTGFSAQESIYSGLLGNAYAGGIIGAYDNQSVGTQGSIEIINCVNNGNVTGWHCTGGITGILYVNDSDYSGEQTCVITNCVNNGSVNSLNQYAGGISGRVYYAVNAKFTGCINNGSITGFSNIGGIIGHTTNTSITISACQNNGEIATTTDETSTAYAGGIIGYAQGTKSSQHSAEYEEYTNRIEFCINTANVSGMRRVGGIVGSSGADGAYGITHTRYCINTGNITNYGIAVTSHAQANAAGIQGYGYGSGVKEYAFVTDCITTGDVEARSAEYGIAAYFLGYISSASAVIARNSGSGTLTSAADKAYCLGWNNNSGTGYAETTLGNNIPATNLYKIAAEAGAESTKDFQNGLFDITALINGSAIADFNAAYKQITGATADCMTQTIDGAFHPQIIQLEVTAPEFPAMADEPETTVAPETEAPVTEAPETQAPETEAPETEAPEVTEAPAATEAPAETEAPAKSGCGSVISGGAILAVLCLATVAVAKKKEF